MVLDLSITKDEDSVEVLDGKQPVDGWSDGAGEHCIRELLVALCDREPKFAHNLHRSSLTGNSPFEIVLGWQPLTPLDVVQRD